MATKGNNTPDTLPNETDEIGKLLEKKYGGSDSDQNAHIRYFYLKIGKGTDQEKKIAKVNEMTRDSECVTVQIAGWNDSLFFASPENKTENECEREASFNETYRQLMLPEFSNYCAIVSRACLYTDTQKCSEKSQESTTTEKIGVILKDIYYKQPAKTHIEHFYLFVQALNGKESILDKGIHTKALEILKTLPGDWKSIEPQKTWLGTFFGFFPKKTSETTEREREKQLNGEVRIPLIAKLKEKLASNDLKPTVKVIITRACVYT